MGQVEFRPITPNGMHDKVGNASFNKREASLGKFGKLIKDQFSEINDMHLEADAAIESFAKGEDITMAEVTTKVKMAGIAFNLLTEIRNKLVAAYDELMRMRV